MKADKFIDLLDDDLAWRKKEISDLVMIYKKGEQEILMKTLILVIYSHWEGFIKNSSKLYLRYISELEIELGTLTYNYKTISVKELIAECMKSKDTRTLQNELTFIKKYKSMDVVKFTISKDILSDKDKSFINTQDNLSPKAFFSICQILGLPEKEAIKTKEKYLDGFMLRNRNAISHGSEIEGGDDYELTISRITALKNIILAIMDRYKEDLAEYAQKEYFLEKKTKKKAAYDKESNEELKGELASYEDASA